MKKSKIKRVKFYIAQIIEALSFLHKKNIIYQDLKPQNILLNKDGYIKLTDFGASKLSKDVDSNYDHFLGTVEYIAPEIIRKKIYNEAIDIWSLGIVSYQLIWGKTPFHKLSTEKIFSKIVYEKINTDFNISSEFKEFLDICFIRDGSKRLSLGSMEILKKLDWFKDINFDLLKEKKLNAYFIPKEMDNKVLNRKNYKNSNLNRN